MSKRTYAGPIIDRYIEYGIVTEGTCDDRAASFHHLAVDAGSGELVIIHREVAGDFMSCLHNPVEYLPAGSRASIDLPFTVTDDLSEMES